MKLPQPWTRDRRGRRYWYLTLASKQILLGSCPIGAPEYRETLDKVREAYGRLISQYQDEKPAKASDYVLTVHAIAALFLNAAEVTLTPDTFYYYRLYVTRFVKTIPQQMRIEELKPHHVYSWTRDDLKGQSPSSINLAITTVKRIFSWAADEGYIELSPIAGVKKPTPRRRETITTADDLDQLFEHSKPHFRDFLVFMVEHGIRPGEGRLIEARHVDLKEGLVELPASMVKTGKKTGRGRKIWLTDRTKEIVSRLAEQYPKGPLFRNTFGGPLSANVVGQTFTKAKKAAGITRSIVLYSIRHAFGTNGLINEIDAATIAATMGHSNPAMLLKIYQHVAQDHKHMRGAAEKLAAANRSTSQLMLDAPEQPVRGKKKRNG